MDTMEAMASVIEIKNLTEYHIHYHRGEALEKLIRNNLTVVDIDISEEEEKVVETKETEQEYQEFQYQEELNGKKGFEKERGYSSIHSEHVDLNQNHFSGDFGYSSMIRSHSTDMLNLRPRNNHVRKIAMVESSTQVFQNEMPNWSLVNDEEDICLDDDEAGEDDERDQVKDVDDEWSHSAGN